MEFNHILIVDDNITNLQVTSKILKLEGYNLSLAQSGNDAIKILDNAELPNLILLDVMMPELDGFDVCNWLKKNPATKEIPVIFLTAKNKTEDIVQGFEMGGIDYIIKPFNREELIARVKNHLELYAAKMEIIQMNKFRDKMYSIITHDIRSPFASISMMIKSIEDGYLEVDSEIFKEIMSDLKFTTENTQALLDNLIEWTKFQSGSFQLLPEKNNLSCIMKECVELFNSTFNKKKIKIHMDLPDELHVFIDCQSVNIVFRNLISNAIKFTPENGKINIKAGFNSKFIEVVIEDTGVGMSEHLIEDILHSRNFISSAGTNNEKGSGLGLILIKDFIKMNKGEMQIESKLGKGTTIKIKFPTIKIT